MAGRTIEEISIILDLSWIKIRNKQYEIVNTKDRLLYHIEKMMHAELIGFDTETTGLKICCIPWTDKTKDRIVGICLSYEINQGIYIPMDHVGIQNISIDLLIKHLFPILETQPVATHNGLFDYKVMYDIGVKLNIVHDSMLLIFNICSHVAKNTKALKIITRKMFGDQTIEFSDIFLKAKDYTKFKYVSEEVCRIYGCADSDYVLAIIYSAIGFLSPSQLQCYMEDCSLIPMFSISEYYGKPIDMTLLPEHRKLCENNITTLRDIIFNYVGYKMSGDLNNRYIFKETSSSELLTVIYDKLGYEPIKSYNDSGRLKMDKFVLKKLKARKSLTDDIFVKEVLKSDVLDPLHPEEPLLKYAELLRAECPIAHMLTALSKQNKNLSTFFSKIHREADGVNCRYFSPISMTNTETARIVDFIQTLDGLLKYLLSPGKGKYLCLFDFCQIEYRVMAALACLRALILNLDNPHTDFHVELAAIILGVKPENITSKMRKKFKPINFAIPYGMAVKGLIEAMYGVGLSGEEYILAEKEVTKMLDQWMTALPEIMEMLNNYRRMAVQPREYHHETMGIYENVSYIQSPSGRLRIFDLGNMEPSVLSSIKRQAGNLPIQEFAGAIYKRAAHNLRDRLVAEGLSDTKVQNPDSPTGFSFTSKVVMNAYVHDEIICSCDDDVNPYFLYKVIREECMLTLPGHPTYYCGINIVHNWKDGKDGNFEAPIDFVDKMKSDKKIMVNEDWPKEVASDMTSYCNKNSKEFLESIAGSKLTQDNILDVEEVLLNWKDYYYKKQLSNFGFKYRSYKVLEEEDSDNAINYAVGTLISQGYRSLKVKYPDKTENIKSFIDESYRIPKEQEFQERLYTNVDIEEDIDLQVDEFLETGEHLDVVDITTITENILNLVSLLV